jgi:hypothetical protein
MDVRGGYWWIWVVGGSGSRLTVGDEVGADWKICGKLPGQVAAKHRDHAVTATVLWVATSLD